MLTFDASVADDDITGSRLHQSSQLSLLLFPRVTFIAPARSGALIQTGNRRFKPVEPPQLLTRAQVHHYVD
jgi:hypothetical protein